jgi:2-phospho-L-lactate guanylyltransferase
VVRFILPIKDLDAAKSRLEVPARWRRALARAMLLDTLTAVQEADLGPVVAVGPDSSVLALARSLGAESLRHTGSLNHAVMAAAGAGRCAAVLPDLPALTAHELRDVLAGNPSGAVRDHTGRGTTMLFGPAIRPSFGPGSAARHAAAGYRLITLKESGLTLDVDTVDDLHRAARLGLGERTAQVYAQLGIKASSPG